MLSSEQIYEIHRLHLVEKWSQRRIAPFSYRAAYLGKVPGQSRHTTEPARSSQQTPIIPIDSQAVVPIGRLGYPFST